MSGVSPVRRLNGIGPQPDRGGVAIEDIPDYDILLSVLDRNADPVRDELVPGNDRLPAVSTPEPVIRAFDAIGDELIATERGLHAVGGGEAEIVAEKQVVVRAARPGVHRRLSRPQKEPVATMGRGVIRNNVAGALRIDEQSGRVLPAAIEAVAVPSNVVVDVVMQNAIAIGAIQSDADAGVERNGVVP